MKRDEFANRYIIKLGSSIVLAFLNAIIQLMLPRALSVEGYGYYSYNLNVFTAVVIMANLSSSSALISKYSKRYDEIGIINFYLKFIAIVGCMLNVGVVMLCLTPYGDNLFRNQTVLLVILGLNAAFCNKLLTDVISMYDAQAISRFPAVIQIALKIIICIVISAAFYFSSLELRLFYLTQIFATVLSIGLLLFFLYRDSRNTYTLSCKKRSNIEYIKEFWEYCRPLIVVSVWAQVNIIIMNWALMNFAGERAQAMFGVALQLNVLLGYIFSPYAELLKREFAVASQDLTQLIIRFKKSLRQMFWVTAYFTVYIAFFAELIIQLLFGSDYLDAVMTVRLMMVYTLYLAWGQVIGSYFLATEQTKKSAIMSGIGLLITLICIFVFQVPNSIFSMGLGSIGIALSYSITNVIVTLISVIVCFYSLKQKQSEHIMVQFFSLMICGIGAIISKCGLELSCRVFVIDSIFVKILISGVVYTCIVAVTVLMFPQQTGIDVRTVYKTIKHKIEKN